MAATTPEVTPDLDGADGQPTPVRPEDPETVVEAEAEAETRDGSASGASPAGEEQQQGLQGQPGCRRPSAEPPAAGARGAPSAPCSAARPAPGPQSPQNSQWGQLLACAAVMSLHTLAGVCMAHSSSLIPALEAADSDVPVTKEQSPWIASSVVLSGPLGALSALALNDRLGRVAISRLMALPNVVGWVVVASAGSLAQIVAGRLLLGASIGLMHGTTLLYCSEVAEKNIRGALGALGTVFASLGILLCYVMGKFLHWRTHAWANCALPLLPLLLMLLLSPESPVWLKDHVRDEEVARASKRLYGDPTRLLSVPSAGGGGRALSWATARLLFTTPVAYKPLIIVQAIFILQQFVGIYITIQYAVPLLKETGSELDPYTVSILIGVVRLVGTTFVALLMPRLGRRPLMLSSSLGQAAAIATSGWASRAILGAAHCRAACAPLQDAAADCEAACAAPSPWWVAGGVLAFIAFGCLGWQVLPWSMMAELFPHEVRSLAQPLNSTAAQLYMFAVLQMYHVLKQLVGGAAGLQFLFAASSALSAVFVWLWLPETRGRTLQDIENYFRHHASHLSARRAKRRPPITPVV